MKTIIVLPDNHRRALTSRLYIIEKQIDDISALMHNSISSFCYKIENDIPIDTINANQKIIDEVKQHISGLVEKYKIQKDIQSKQRIISTKKSLIWEILCDSDSNKLKAYGDFPEKHKKQFDSDIEKLLKLTEKIII